MMDSKSRTHAATKEKFGARFLHLYREVDGDDFDFIEQQTGIRFKRYASVFIGNDGGIRHEG
jgi:hypothetical protein